MFHSRWVVYDPLLSVVVMEYVPKVFAALSCGGNDPVAVTISDTISPTSTTTELGQDSVGGTAP